MSVTRKQIITEMKHLFQEINTLYQEVQQLSRLLRNKQNVRLEDYLTQSESSWNMVVEEVTSMLTENINERSLKILELINQGGLQTAPWNDQAWGYYQLQPTKLPPTSVRVGELIYKPISDFPKTPALVPFVTQNNLYISSSNDLIKSRSQLINSMLWRIVAFSSPKTYQLLLIDPHGLGRNFSSLLNLPEIIRGDKVFCQPREIQENLEIILEKITDRIQNKLKDKYKSIEEFNLGNPRFPIPYQIIALSDFPNGFTDDSIKFLKKISKIGNKAGVYIVGGVETNPAQFDYSLYATFLENGTLLNVINKVEAEWDDPLLANLKINPDPEPSDLLIELISGLVTESIESISDTFYFPEIFPSLKKWWSLDSINDLRFPIGYFNDKNIYDIILGQQTEAFHMLIGGRTRSGKSNFLHLLILGLCTNYSPDELDLYLIDFKDGVEFQDYAKFQLPHARAITMEAEREYGVSILKFIDEEMERRSVLFKQQNINAVNIIQYRETTGEILPRILVIIDEFVKLFEYDDYLSDYAHSYLLRIAQRGGAFGIHLVLAAQRPIGLYQQLNDVLSQISQRIAFKCNTPSDSTLILGERNEKAAYLKKAGIACVTSDPNLVRETTEINIPLITSEDRELYLDGFSKLMERKKTNNKKDQIIFRKYEPAYWMDSNDVSTYLNDTTLNDDCLYPTIWLGEPVSLAKDFRFYLQQKETQNILLVSNEEEVVDGFILNSILSLILSTPPELSEYYLFCSYPDMEKIKPYLKVLSEVFPNNFYGADTTIDENSIEEIFERLQIRQKDFQMKKQTFLLFYGLHRLRFFHSEDQYSQTEAGETLGKIIKGGPSVGIHSLIWTNKSSDLYDVFGSRNINEEFCHCLMSHASIDESNTILNSKLASSLESNMNRVYYRNQDWPDKSLEKVKIFSRPAPKKFAEIVYSINNYWRRYNV